MMKYLPTFLFFLLFLPGVVQSQEKLRARSIHDEHNREMAIAGYVVITEDRLGPVNYTSGDYQRMVRMGANVQVIRTALGRLGGWPGRKADPNYPAQLDAMVRMGREAGLKTIFKLVVYDCRPFGHADWDAIYENTGGTRDTLLAAWKSLWTRYQHEPSVFGYDLLNEPQRGLDRNEVRCFHEQLLPTLRHLTDALHEISPDKWALFQPLYRETGAGTGPFLPMTEAFGRERVIYAPHLYSMDAEKAAKMLDRYLREAALSKAPLILGEWGPATDLAADADPVKQARYTRVYEATANALDRRGIGAIKAWFCGTRVPLKTKNRREPFTWAIFSDHSPAGKVERRFVTDALSRPRPLTVSGHLRSYGFDFETHVLELVVEPGAGPTRIFVPKDRYYSGGFHLSLGTDPKIVLTLREGEESWSGTESLSPVHQAQVDAIDWEAGSQQVIIEAWKIKTARITIKVSPLTRTAE
ncbi:cellulase family glycosylhydrolase [Verrucomicrobiaceae bacterium 227]